MLDRARWRAVVRVLSERDTNLELRPALLADDALPERAIEDRFGGLEAHGWPHAILAAYELLERRARSRYESAGHVGRVRDRGYRFVD